MSRPIPDPLADVELLLVDASNLLHAANAARHEPGAAPAQAIVGRIRGAVPPSVTVELIFDGPPDRGLGGARIASGVTVRYGGRLTADEVLVQRVIAETAAAAPGSADRILVVTDDRALRLTVRARGARTAGATWLLRRIARERLVAPSVGNPRAPRPAGTAMTGRSSVGDETGDDDRPGWRAGRWATRKRGNPRRGRPC